MQMLCNSKTIEVSLEDIEGPDLKNNYFWMSLAFSSIGLICLFSVAKHYNINMLKSSYS